MPDRDYDVLADVYDWLVPDALLTPEGSVAAFASAADPLPAAARVLDCAAGTGQLAVGLALRGFDVVAADASGAMIERTLRLARDRGAQVEGVVCAWEELPERTRGEFDAVFCVGNSLTHAEGRARRRAALAAMSHVLRPDGRLVITSRNWEAVRAAGSGLHVADRLVERDGVRGLVVYAWTIPEALGEPHYFDVAVALLANGDEVTTHRERLRFWPFTHDELDEDLRAAGLAPSSTTYAPDADRYMVTAARLRSQPGLDRG
jgi:SAM-dependent methyltransferase